MSLIISVLVILAIAPMVIKMFAWLLIWAKKQVKKIYETFMEVISREE